MSFDTVDISTDPPGSPFRPSPSQPYSARYQKLTLAGCTWKPNIPTVFPSFRIEPLRLSPRPSLRAPYTQDQIAPERVAPVHVPPSPKKTQKKEEKEQPSHASASFDIFTPVTPRSGVSYDARNESCEDKNGSDSCEDKETVFTSQASESPEKSAEATPVVKGMGLRQPFKLQRMISPPASTPNLSFFTVVRSPDMSKDGPSGRGYYPAMQNLQRGNLTPFATGKYKNAEVMHEDGDRSVDRVASHPIHRMMPGLSIGVAATESQRRQEWPQSNNETQTPGFTTRLLDNNEEPKKPATGLFGTIMIRQPSMQDIRLCVSKSLIFGKPAKKTKTDVSGSTSPVPDCPPSPPQMSTKVFSIAPKNSSTAPISLETSPNKPYRDTHHSINNNNKNIGSSQSQKSSFDGGANRIFQEATAQHSPLVLPQFSLRKTFGPMTPLFNSKFSPPIGGSIGSVSKDQDQDPKRASSMKELP